MPEEGSRWRDASLPADTPLRGCLYCTEEHTTEERGMVALISAIRGHLVKVQTPDGTWLVPREYLDLHKQPRASDLPLLADLFGWSKVA